jgi:aminoglycoside 6'-N-acetyltransferase I
VLGFLEHWPDAWPDLEAALAEVHELLSAEAILRAAVDTDGTLLGWIGGMGQYSGNAWELHPLVVHPTFQRQGIGSALVADLAARVAERGGHTLWLGSDDVDALTSVSGLDLYPTPWSTSPRSATFAATRMSFTRSRASRWLASSRTRTGPENRIS